MEPANVTKIGKYEILGILGKGGMGVVYKATDPAIGRLVAIKVITTGLAESTASLKRFYREAQSTGKLQHQNIVIIHELGEQNGAPFLVMEFLEGESLQSVINARRSLPLLDKLNLIIQVCNGLDYAHQHGIIHRDIKPANLMILKNGLLKIVDFGIARFGTESFTLPGQIMGSIYYMSPEQLTGSTVDIRTDIFSTGVVLYELLTHTLPFKEKDVSSTLQKIANEPPPPLAKFIEACPEHLESVLLRALAKSRADRYQNAEDFAFELGQIQTQLRREFVSEQQKLAEDLIARSEFNKAKEHLLQILRSDRQNRRASELLKELQQRAKSKERAEQLRQLRNQADEAISSRQFDLAINYLDQAVIIAPEDSEWQTLRAHALEAKLRLENVEDALRRAESSHWAGELDEALAALEEARRLDPDHPDVKALHDALAREISERDRHLQIKMFLDEAQRKISSRRYTDAIEVLQRAESLDPGGQSIKDLMSLAANCRQQERRRKEIEKLTAEIQEALDHDNYSAAFEKADGGLKLFPDERALLKLRALSEKQRQASDKRHFVDEQIRRARRLLEEGQTESALATLDAAAKRFPTEPSLLSMMTAVRETLRQERSEAQKRDYLQRAEEALRCRDYEQATAILEAARAELDSPEIEDMLQFVKDEVATLERKQVVDAAAQEAHHLISAGSYEEAIDLLKSILREISDEDLEITLADAQRRLEEFSRKVREVTQAGDRLLNAGRITQAVRYLESHADSCGSASEFRAVLERARHEQERASVIGEAVQSARSSLSAQDFGAASATIGACRQKVGDHAELSRTEKEIDSQRRETASKAVSKAITHLRMLLLGRSYAAAVEIHEGVAGMLDWVTVELRERYIALHDEALRGLQRTRDEAGLPGTSPSPRAANVDDTEQQLEWAAPFASSAALTRQETTPEQQQVANLREGFTAPPREKSPSPSNQQSGNPAVREPEPALKIVSDPETLHSFQSETAFVPQSPQTEATARALFPAESARPDSKIRDHPQLTVVADDDRGRRFGGKWLLTAGSLLVLALIALIWFFKNTGTTGTIPLTVQTIPEGAVVQVMDSTCVTPKCKLELPPGNYKVYASLPGYASRSETLQVEKGKAPPKISLALEPLLPVVRISTNFANANVRIDDQEAGALKNGQLELHTAHWGRHTVRITAADGEADFDFTAAPAHAPVLIRPVRTRDLSLIAVSTLGTNTRLDCNCTGSLRLAVDDHPVGEVTDAGRDLGDIGEGLHQFSLGVGEDARTATAKVGSYPALDVFLNAGRNVGTLVVDTDTTDADVFVNNKHYRYTKGLLRVPLDASDYTVTVQKDGYQPAGPERVQIRKNQEARLTFKMIPQNQKAFVAIRGGVPGASVDIDKAPAGVIGDDGQFYSPPLDPGEHVIQMDKKGYQSRIVEAPVERGEIFNISGEQAKLIKSAPRQ